MKKLLNRKLLKLLPITVALTSIAIASFGGQATANQALQSTDSITERITSTSSPVNVPGFGYFPGNTYTFKVEQPQDRIVINVVPTQGSNLDAYLVVTPPNLNPRRIYNNSSRDESFVENASVPGDWQISVISANNNPGEYQLSLTIYRNGQVLQKTVALSYPDEVMKRFNLATTACSSADRVALIRIGSEVRCTSNYAVGEYIFQEPNVFQPVASKQEDDCEDEEWCDEEDINNEEEEVEDDIEFVNWDEEEEFEREDDF